MDLPSTSGAPDVSPLAVAPRTVILTKRFGHHTASGGYDRLADYMDADRVQRTTSPGLAFRICDKAWNLLHGPRAIHPMYSLGDRIMEERVFWRAMARRYDIIHALNGDEQIDVLLRRIHLFPARLVLSVHYPSAQVAQIFRNVPGATIARLGGVVTVGSEEVPGLEAIFGMGRVAYVPHGIDVAAFTPDAARRPNDMPHFVFVGWHMRDFEVAHLAIDRCTQAGIEARFDVVAREDMHRFFAGCRNVRLHSGIGEAALLALYRQADALFLPLRDATANNSVLEALACGTPVISTAVGSLGDYVDEGCGWLLPPGDAEAAFACIAAIAADPRIAAGKRAAARAKAETFAWERVAARLREVHAAFAREGRAR